MIDSIITSNNEMKWNKLKTIIKMISNESLRSRNSPSIDWEISINVELEPSTDCACNEKNVWLKTEFEL